VSKTQGFVSELQGSVSKLRGFAANAQGLVSFPWGFVGHVDTEGGTLVKKFTNLASAMLLFFRAAIDAPVGESVVLFKGKM